MVGGNFHDGHVGQHVVFLAGHEAVFLVEDGAHVLVGGEEALHEEVAFAFVDEFHCQGAGLVVVGFLDHFELVGVDAFLGADFLHGVDVAHEGSLDDTAVDSGADGGDGVAIVCIGSHETFFTFGFDQLEEVVKFRNHLIANFLLLI